MYQVIYIYILKKRSWIGMSTRGGVYGVFWKRKGRKIWYNYIIISRQIILEETDWVVSKEVRQSCMISQKIHLKPVYDIKKIFTVQRQFRQAVALWVRWSDDGEKDSVRKRYYCIQRLLGESTTAVVLILSNATTL